MMFTPMMLMMFTAAVIISSVAGMKSPSTLAQIHSDPTIVGKIYDYAVGGDSPTLAFPTLAAIRSVNRFGYFHMQSNQPPLWKFRINNACTHTHSQFTQFLFEANTLLMRGIREQDHCFAVIKSTLELFDNTQNHIRGLMWHDTENDAVMATASAFVWVFGRLASQLESLAIAARRIVNSDNQQQYPHILQYYRSIESQIMTLLLFHLIPQKLNQLQLNADFFAGSDIDVPLLKPLGGEYNNIWRVIARLTALKSLTIENLNSVNWIRRLNSHFSLHAIKLTQLHVSWTGQQAVAFDLTMLLYRMRDTLTVLELSGPGASKLFHVLGTRISDFKRQQQLLVLDPLYTAADSSPAFIAGLFKLNELKYLALPALQSNDVLPWQEQLLQVGTPKFDIGFAQDPLNCASVRIVGFPRVLCAQMARHLAWYEDPNFEGRATVLFEGFQSIQVHGHRIVDSGILPSTRSDGEESFGRLARLHVSGVNLQQSFAISQNLHFLPSLTSVQLNIDASYKLLTTEEAFRQQKVRHLFIIYALLSMKQLKQIKLTGVEIGLDDIIWIIKGDSLMLNQVTDLAIELSGASWISWPGNSEEMIRTQILPRLPQTGLDSLIITRGPSGEMILNWNRSN